MLLDAYKQERTSLMFAEPLLTGFECVTIAREALVADKCRDDRE